MGLFGKSFEEKVQEAIGKVEAELPGARELGATCDGEVVTLHGLVPDLDAKRKAMIRFNELVETENTLNRIRLIDDSPTVPMHEGEQHGGGGAPVAEPARTHVVEAGDTLGALAQRYYGRASEYMKIFNANRDILDHPDRIKVGQELRIPE